MMNRATSLSGDTLIACHFPLVQVPHWQLPVQALCASTKRSGRLCSAGLTRAISLPEQDTQSRETGLQSSLRHTSSSYSNSLQEDRHAEEEEEDEEEEEVGSYSSGKCDSVSSPEEAPPLTNSHRKKEGVLARSNLRSHNSFLPKELDEEDEDSDGDNLHKYHEDSSFLLHGNSNWTLNNGGKHIVPANVDLDTDWAGGDTILGREQDREFLSVHLNQSDQQGCQHLHDHRTHTVGREEQDCQDNSLRCGREGPCFSSGYPKRLPESFSNGQLDFVSDSSCNSSDGILVNFSAIYDGSNNPATPHDFSSPAVQASQSAEGSVFLDLEPVPVDIHTGGPRSTTPPQVVPSAPCWSPQALDSNCNLYPLDPHPPLEPQSQGLPSPLGVSELSACLQSQATLAAGAAQKYYKLVTCDLSSQSPSPAWSSLTSCSEGPAPSSEYFLFNKGREHEKVDKKDKEEQKERRRLCQLQGSTEHPRFGTYDSQYTPSIYGKAHYKKGIIDIGQSFQSLCPIQEAVCQGRSSEQNPGLASPCQSNICEHTPQSGGLDQNHGTEEEVACAWVPAAAPLVRYSKAQRPTSLPIQPFTLLTPPGKPPSQPLGTLLDQYIHNRTGGSQPGDPKPASKCKGTGNRLLSHLRPSPLGGHGPILLEALSSSDTCSTCTPSPERHQHLHRPSWSHRNMGQTRVSPQRPRTSPGLSDTSPKQGPLVDHPRADSSTVPTRSSPSRGHPQPPSPRAEVPTCQDLIRLTPEQSHTSTRPNHLSPIPDPGPRPISIQTPPSLSLPHPTLQPALLVSISPATPLQTRQKRQLPSARVLDSGSFHCSLTAALSSAGPLSSLSSLLSLAGSGLQQQQQPSDSLILSDRPPVDFCLSPEASYESLSISHLQRRGLLKSVSRAVDLIMAHFGSSRDPEEKIRLGNSSRSPTISALVLEHLCPAVQDILQDGLRDHKLDLIIGQRRNHSWNVVEASTQIGVCTRVLHSLIYKINQCPQLTSPCMRLRAFLMGLLNLRSLEFWLSHLHSQKDFVPAHYHSWGFLPMSQGRCEPLFQELLLLLQPLSVMPFDLNLLLEPRLLESRQLCSEEQGVPPPCPAFLMTSWPLLRAERQDDSKLHATRDPHQAARHPHGPSWSAGCLQPCSTERPEEESTRSRMSAPSPGWWQRQPAHVESGLDQRDCSRHEEERTTERPRAAAEPGVQGESASQGGLRWAKLFGAAGDPSTRTPRVSHSFRSRPSQWLQLDKSQLGLLAQTVWSGKLVGVQTDRDQPPIQTGPGH
ncbi:AP-4 complex accessory subunit RUSC2 [Aplochiton taeniatus]